MGSMNDELQVYAEEIFRTELQLQAVVETLAELRKTRKRKRQRDADLAWCQARVEETPQLLHHIMRDQDAARRRP
jgi:hypothetical protein